MYKKRKSAFLSFILATSIISTGVMPVFAESAENVQQTLGDHNIVGASNMFDAPALEIGQRYTGYCETNDWFSFTIRNRSIMD